ncbi:hypothetical protein GCM10010964_18320 [Caldovatus sediminis]|uniref:HTH cro/C1-type domain-containing protein n=2 Tax=Caldovatus sediminis TaxID=2041189 RepID=A0A8J3EC14_9PROT|nr:hypothetical protein [Caldovatus sediminis]GGG30738.1 hypothetical protein GCM10010964_18320 [Caldovatus sediminis]
MPVGTLNRYIAGRDMKASALVALAAACGVRVEWLATGRGAMTPGEALQRERARAEEERAAPAAAPPEPLALAGIPLPPEALAQPWRCLLDLRALAWALAFAEQLLAARGGGLATPEVRLHLAFDTLEELRRAIGRPLPDGWRAGLDLDTLARMLGLVEMVRAPRPERADALRRLRGALINYDLALYDHTPGAEPPADQADEGWELLPPEPPKEPPP